MADFDQAGRYLIRRAPAGFFAWLAPRFLADWDFRGWIDTSTLTFPGEPDRICDTVGEFVHRSDRARRCLLDVEIQSRPHVDMLERQGEYAYRLRREQRYGRGRRGKYQVIAVLLNLTGAVQPHVLDMTEPALNDAGLRLEVVQRTLREEDSAATLARIATGELQRCVLPWVVLMRDAGRSAMIQEWKRLALREPDERWRREYGALALVFSDLTRHALVWNRALGGWQMERSRHVMEWEARARRKDLLRVLQLRFHDVPAEINAAIAEQKGPDELSRLLDLAVTTSSLDEFRAALSQP